MPDDKADPRALASDGADVLAGVAPPTRDEMEAVQGLQPVELRDLIDAHIAEVAHGNR